MLSLLKAALLHIPEATEVKETVPLSTLPRQYPYCIRKVLEFASTRESLRLTFLCYETDSVLTISCRALAVIFDLRQQASITQNIVDAQFAAVTLNLKEGLAVVTMEHLYRPTCSPEALAEALNDIQDQHLTFITWLQARYPPFAPISPSKASPVLLFSPYFEKNKRPLRIARPFSPQVRQPSPIPEMSAQSAHIISEGDRFNLSNLE